MATLNKRNELLQYQPAGIKENTFLDITVLVILPSWTEISKP